MESCVISPTTIVLCSIVAWAVKAPAAAGMKQKQPPQSNAVAKRMLQARRKICRKQYAGNLTPPPTSLYPPEALPGGAALGTKRRPPPSPIIAWPLLYSCRSLPLYPGYRWRFPRANLRPLPLAPARRRLSRGLPGLPRLPGYLLAGPGLGLRVLSPLVLLFPFLLSLSPAVPAPAWPFPGGQGSTRSCTWHQDRPGSPGSPFQIPPGPFHNRQWPLPGRPPRLW